MKGSSLLRGLAIIFTSGIPLATYLDFRLQHFKVSESWWVSGLGVPVIVVVVMVVCSLICEQEESRDEE